MATNLKGQGGIKGLMLLHGEKIAIAIVVALSLWIVYKSTKLDRLDDKHQAAELTKEINQTNAQITASAWDTAVKEYPDKVKPFVPIPATKSFNVDPKAYANEDASGKPVFAIDPPVVAPMIRRTDPVLLNAVDVRATGGSGLLSFVDEKIKRDQAVKREADEAARLKIEEEKQKKAQKDQKNQGGANPRPKRGSEMGPGSMPAELVDPDHPKRRLIQSSVRPTGIQLQGGERTERAYWACVVAKVPIREQLKLYQDAFEKARGYDENRDFPHYLGYVVERAEVLPDQPLDWKRVPLYDGQRQSVTAGKPIAQVVNSDSVTALSNAAQQFWAGMAPEVVDPHFTDPILTLPLPPLVGRDWGADATHPDIPVLGPNTPSFEEEVKAAPEQAPAQPAKTGEDEGFGSSTQLQQGPGGPGFAMPARPGMVPGGGFRPPGREGPGGPGFAPGGVGRFRGGPEGRPSFVAPGGGPGQRTGLAKGLDFLLLRFFDYTVEPGKKYKYRVKLVLADPNIGMPANVLAAAVLDRQAKSKDRNGRRLDYRALEKFSDPSPTVGIPLAGNVRLADTKIPAAEKFNDEPVAKLLVESFDADDKGNAIQAAVEKDFRRGAVANMVEDGDYIVPGEGGTMIDTQPGFKFMTGMTLLDIDGGTKLAKDMYVPARILVMGPAGELYVHDEVDDKPAVEYHRLLFEKTSDKHRGPYNMPGPGGQEGPRAPRAGRR